MNLDPTLALALPIFIGSLVSSLWVWIYAHSDAAYEPAPPEDSDKSTS